MISSSYSSYNVTLIMSVRCLLSNVQITISETDIPSLHDAACSTLFQLFIPSLFPPNIPVVTTYFSCPRFMTSLTNVNCLPIQVTSWYLLRHLYNASYSVYDIRTILLYNCSNFSHQITSHKFTDCQ